MSFVKLLLNTNIDNYIVEDFVVSYGDRIFYNKVSTNFDIFKIVPDQYRKYFFSRYMEVTNYIPPHTDSGIKCTVNFYIETGNCVTKFWSIKNQDDTLTYQVENQTNGKLFKKEALNFHSQFKAEAGDAYLLDVSKPHSVEAESFSIRKALCLQTNHFTFEQVKEMLNESKLI